MYSEYDVYTYILSILPRGYVELCNMSANLNIYVHIHVHVHGKICTLYIYVHCTQYTVSVYT